MAPAARLDPFYSLPALAAAVRSPRAALGVPAESGAHARSTDSTGSTGSSTSNRLGPCHLHAAGLVPMYRIAPPSPEPAAEAAAAAQVVLTVGDRLRRLTTAYGEWAEFDPAAYFDLTTPQSACLLQLTERVTSVHLVFHMDMLLPSFQNTAMYWESHFVPHYTAMREALAHSALAHRHMGHTVGMEAGAVGQTTVSAPVAGTDTDAAGYFFDAIQPEMLAHWLRLLTVVRHTRRLLSDDPTFWAFNAANDERLRQRWAWRQRPASGIATSLLPNLSDIPTLTLAIDFPLPAARQSGRMRRLRRGRAHQARRARPQPHDRGSDSAP